MSSLPRFPIPFLESLLKYASWRDVLHLTSVDKLEAQMRAWLISGSGQFKDWTIDDSQLVDRFERYPQATLRAVIPSCRHPHAGAHETYARITYLELDYPKNVDDTQLALVGWPPNLRSLRTKYWDQMPLLPPTLRKLTLNVCTHTFPLVLGQLYQLESLEIHGSVMFEVLPPALLEIVLHNPHPAIKTFSRWPPSLSTLRIVMQGRVATFDNFSMAHPPVGLKKLDLDYDTLAAAVVPEGVEWVRACADDNTFVFWPASLKEVHFTKFSVRLADNIREGFNRIGLPKNIRRVTIGGVEYTRSGFRK
jgi:hypothetical protein